MGRKRTPGLFIDPTGIWQIDKVVVGERLRGSTGTRDLEEAEAILHQRVSEIRKAKLLGIRPKRTWRDAATRHLRDCAEQRSIGDDALHLKLLDGFIGEMPLDRIHDGTLAKFIEARRAAEVKNATINRALEVVRKILNKAARAWRDESGLTWLTEATLITMLDEEADARPPRAISWDEQSRFFAELPGHLQKMALFKVNTGCREQEVCQLRWAWEQWIPELKRSVFLIPAWVELEDSRRAGLVKNGEDRLVVLNRIAQSVIDGVRGEHEEFVFTYRGRGKPERGAIRNINNSGWQKARKRVALDVRVHDLKHTFGRRLRAAGVPLETRKVLLGHRNGDITEHYSPAEIGELLTAVDKLCEATERKVTILRVVRG